MTTTEVVPHKEKHRSIAVKKENQDSMLALIERAVFDPACDVAKLERLLAVKDNLDAEVARKAFVTALADFKADAPDVFKGKKVHFETMKGNTDYSHATLGKASSIISAAASKHGLSHTWDVNQKDGVGDKPGKIFVSCILTHSLGHSKTVTMEAAADGSGSKNAIQAIGSAVSYLQRYTLFAAYGIAAKDQDDDGVKSGKRNPAEPIPGPEDDWKPAVEPGAKLGTTGTASFKVGKKFIGKSEGKYVMFESQDGTLYHLTEAEAKTAKANFQEGDTATITWEIRDDLHWIKSLDRKAVTPEKEF